MGKNTKLILIAGIIGFVVISVSILMFLTFIGNSRGGMGGAVAVIPIEGTIAYGQSDIFGGAYVNPDVTKDLIKQAEEDSSVKSILLEINSPGGAPVASEEIMQAVKNCNKPVVVWISDIGASGAYLVASPADKIVASPSSWVGSIGVLLDITDLSELYQKIGINKYAIKGGEYKDMGADYRNLTPTEKKMLQDIVNEHYEYFISLVAENRKLSKDYVRSIAEGKIYTGRQAKDIKLIDELGGKQQALDIAAKMGGINGSYDVYTMTPPETFQDILSTISSQIAYSLGRGIGSFMQKGTIEYVFR